MKCSSFIFLGQTISEIELVIKTEAPILDFREFAWFWAHCCCYQFFFVVHSAFSWHFCQRFLFHFIYIWVSELRKVGRSLTGFFVAVASSRNLWALRAMMALWTFEEKHNKVTFVPHAWRVLLHQHKNPFMSEV